jgi:AcrR family transcriptional regulator
MVLKNKDFQSKNGDSASHAPDRLLDAAERLFCERGFDGTSVRDLTKAADCNVAAVNYHFGSKDRLYRQMFRRHMERVFAVHRKNIDGVMAGPNPTLEKLLETLIRTALEELGESNGKIPMFKLMIRETLDPQLREEFVELGIVKEFLQQIRDAIIKLLPGLDEEKAMLCVYSLEGLVIHPLLFSDFYYEMTPELKIEELTQHIVKFATEGIRKAAKPSE